MSECASEVAHLLLRELDTWRRTSLDQLQAQQVRLPTLEALAVESNERGGPVQLLAIRHMLIAAVAQARAATWSDDGSIAYCGPLVMQEVFGLTRASMNASAGKRQTLAGEKIDRAGHSVRRFNAAQVRQMAAWVGEYGRTRLPSEDERATSWSSQGLIDRGHDQDWLLARYKQLSGAGGFFLLYGMAGVGKTTLALMFADRVAPSGEVAVVRFGRRGLFEEDIRHVLQLAGQDSTGWSDEQCQAAFRAAVQTKIKLRLIIFDGVSGLDEVTALVPLGTRTPILITSRERLLPRDAHGAQVQASHVRAVRALTPEQGTRLLSGRLPTVNATTLNRIRDVLGGHPEALDRVSCYLALDAAMTAEQLLDDLTRTPARALDELGEVLDTPTGLRFAMEQLLRQLQPDSLAYDILICVIWANDVGQLPRDFLMGLVTELRREEPSSLAIDAALRLLDRLGLMHSAGSALGTSGLACQILRDLLLESFEPVLLALERMISKPAGSPPYKTLLEVLRSERAETEPLRQVLADMLDNVQGPQPYLACIDERNWCLYATDREGKRHASLYRIVPTGIVYLGPAAEAWQSLTDRQITPLTRVTRWYARLLAQHKLNCAIDEAQRQQAEQLLGLLTAFEAADNYDNKESN